MLLATAVSNTSGPSFTVQGWVAWIIILGSIALSLAAIWKVIVPFVAACSSVIRRMQTLDDIAQEFRPNSGTTLHDRLLAIDRTTTSTHDNLRQLWDYSHQSHHSIVNALVKVAPGVDIITALAKKLGAMPQQMPEDPA